MPYQSVTDRIILLRATPWRCQRRESLLTIMRPGGIVNESRSNEHVALLNTQRFYNGLVIYGVACLFVHITSTVVGSPIMGLLYIRWDYHKL